jgi:hypothetical protein
MMNHVHRNIKLDSFRVKDEKVYIIGFGSILKYQDASGFLLSEKKLIFHRFHALYIHLSAQL